MEVNKLLQNTCGSYNFYFIDNTNVNKESDLNMGGLHLNYMGTYVLGGNLVNAIRLWPYTQKMYYMCTHDLTQTVDGNVSQTPDNISKTQKGRGCIELLTLNEENSIQLSNSDNPSLIFNELKRKNSDRIIIGHININFIENKFEALVALVNDKVDIIMISETKIDFQKLSF